MGISLSPAQPLHGAPSPATPPRESPAGPRGLDAVDPPAGHAALGESGRAQTGSAAGTGGGLTFAHVFQSALRSAGAGLATRGGTTGPTGSRGRLAAPAFPFGGIPASAAAALRSLQDGVHRDKDDDMLDAAFRQTVHLAPPPAVAIGLAQPFQQGLPATASPSSSEVRAFASFEDLLPALVRKIAWSGDARRGSVRLELGAGALSGATLLVRADGGQLHVSLRTPPGTPVEDWRRRITARLEAKGLDATSVEVE